MTAPAAVGLALWLLLTVASVVAWWWAERRSHPVLRATRWCIGVLAAIIAGTGAVAILAAVAAPLERPWSWVSIGIATAAAVATGSVLTLAVLALADTSSASTTGPTVLRGGAWIGALERIGLLGSLLAGSAEAVVAIIAVKSLARYPELKIGQDTGASERFIIGTFTSLGWAAVCAGIALVLRS